MGEVNNLPNMDFHNSGHNNVTRVTLRDALGVTTTQCPAPGRADDRTSIKSRPDSCHAVHHCQARGQPASPQTNRQNGQQSSATFDPSPIAASDRGLSCKMLITTCRCRGGIDGSPGERPLCKGPDNSETNETS